MPDDLTKLSNVIKNDVVKKTVYNTLKSKVDAIDTSGFVTRTKFTADTNALVEKIDKVDKKIVDITGLATKSSIASLLAKSAFNSKVTELENKITAVDNKVPSITGLATKTELTAVENKIPDVTGLVKKSDYVTEISAIKNDCTTSASLDSKVIDLKAQHIADEVKKVDDKVKKNASDILGFESRLKQKKTLSMRRKEKIALTEGFIIILKKVIWFISASNTFLEAVVVIE